MEKDYFTPNVHRKNFILIGIWHVTWVAFLPRHVCYIPPFHLLCLLHSVEDVTICMIFSQKQILSIIQHSLVSFSHMWCCTVKNSFFYLFMWAHVCVKPVLRWWYCCDDGTVAMMVPWLESLDLTCCYSDMCRGFLQRVLCVSTMTEETPNLLPRTHGMVNKLHKMAVRLSPPTKTKTLSQRFVLF